MTLQGRRILLTDETSIDSGNILRVLNDIESTHLANRTEIEYLWKYYKGDQPVLSRVKEVRPEICNKILENRANEIVSFKVGYLCGEPVQYIARGSEDSVAGGVSKLNEMMFLENKASLDREIVEWQMICGTAFRMVLPDDDAERDEVPFEIYTPDPRNTFVVYQNAVGNKPLMGITYTEGKNGEKSYNIYTKDEFFVVKAGAIIRRESHILGMIPIIEYPANNARLGSFEIVLPLLDAINSLQSNRMDGVEQFVQAYWKFIGCNIDHEKFEEFKREGAILVPPNDGGGNIDVDLIVKELNQSQTQTLKEDLYQTVLTICGIPNRNGGTSTSDTGAAVIMRDGWSLAEARAKDSEVMFKSSEAKFLRLVLRILRDMENISVSIADIDVKFTRRNYEAIQSKSQVLISMLQQPKIHPLLAFAHSGLFSDAESAYTMSMDYYKEEQQKLAQQQAQTGNISLNKTIEEEGKK